MQSPVQIDPLFPDRGLIKYRDNVRMFVSVYLPRAVELLHITGKK